MLKNTYKLDEDFPKASIDAIAKEKEEEVKKAYEELKDPELFDKICEETRDMIPQIDERIHYWEDRRTLFLQVSLGITAAALAGIVAITSEMDKILSDFFSISTILYIPILVLCISLIIGGIRILSLWNEQNNPTYPFTKATKTWRWQYRHSETEPTSTDFQKFTPKIVEEEAYKFAHNLADYKIKLLKSKEMELLDQDISQLYLLMINEKFKIKFVSKLRDTLFLVLKYSFCFTIISIILLGIIILVHHLFC